MKSAPTVMVSSTFYDLKQVRADLAAFISDELGYTALLSELPSFPVDPDLDTIQNCRRRVEQNADILVLIIGGRYGSIDVHTDKSITNIEYSTARAKGIPVYVFVEKRILSVLPIWLRNSDGDFSDVVDTPRVFDFLTQIRTAEGVWVFSFEVAKDIVETLRMQLAHLFGETLQMRLRLGVGPFPAYLNRLGPRLFVPPSKDLLDGSTCSIFKLGLTKSIIDPIFSDNTMRVSLLALPKK